MARYSIRLTRLDDRGSFRRVVDFLARLYPDRDPAEFEAALARLPCLLTESADEAAMSALKAALERRGGRVLAMPIVEAAEEREAEVEDAPGSSQEIDLAFLQRSAARKRSARAQASDSEGRALPADESVAPWEEPPPDASRAPWER